MDKVMLVDDELDLQSTIKKMLVRGGYEFCGATDGEQGMRLLEREAPDLVLLDVMLPNTNGFDFCRAIRDRGYRVPVIFLSAKTDIVDKSVGFKVGGDDYVTKPFSAAELLMRIEAHIRRYKDSSDYSQHIGWDGVTRVGDLEVRNDEYKVFVKGRLVVLTAKEFEVVAFLAHHPGKVFTRAQIYEYLWGKDDSDAKSNSITMLMRRIRIKIEDNPSEPKYLLTVQGVGYKMADA